MAKKKVPTKKTIPKTKAVDKLQPKSKAFFGWTPDTPDHRDMMFSLPKKMKNLPSKIDLRTNQIAIFSQGSLGSCTANAVATAFIFSLIKQNDPLFVPSRLFIYYNTRLRSGNVNIDSGATLRSTVKSINKVGVCEEKYWPYTIEKFKNKPTESSYNDADGNKAVKYERLSRSLYDFKSCLASGYPFVCGFAVYESFQSKEIAKTGKMSMPDLKERSLGGHAVIVMGYDDDTECFIVKNSWGTKWGDKGYFYMPYDYLLNHNLSDDFWVIQKVVS